MSAHLLSRGIGCRGGRRVASMKKGSFEAVRACRVVLRDGTQQLLLLVSHLCAAEVHHG